MRTLVVRHSRLRQTPQRLDVGVESECARLEDEIAELFAQITAASYRLLVLIRQFDEAGGWQQDFRTCAHWLNWRVGLRLGAAREWVRVARALKALPQVSVAMEQGLVSFSKVRAITRVATPDTEERLLNFALSSTAAHTETLVKKVRSSEKTEEELIEEGQSLWEGRELAAYTDADGMVVVRARLDPESGAVFLAALEEAEDALFQAGPRSEEVSSEAEREECSAAQRRVDALAQICESARATRYESGNRVDRHQVVLHVQKGEPAALELGDCGRKDVSAETSERFCCDASQVVMHHDSDGSVLDVGRKTRAISVGLRRALRARDQRCQFPGCSCRFVEAHHVQPWSQGGETKLDNLVLLCRRHHRSMHDGGYTMVAAPADALEEWWFFRPNGEPFSSAPPLPDQLGTVVDEMKLLHHARGVSPAAGGHDAAVGWVADRLAGGLLRLEVHAVNMRNAEAMAMMIQVRRVPEALHCKLK